MINAKPGTKVICNYRGRHIGEVIEPSTGKAADSLLSQAEYCEQTERTPVQYPFGVMEDSDRSLTVVDEALAKAIDYFDIDGWESYTAWCELGDRAIEMAVSDGHPSAKYAKTLKEAGYSR